MIDIDTSDDSLRFFMATSSAVLDLAANSTDEEWEQTVGEIATDALRLNQDDRGVMSGILLTATIARLYFADMKAKGSAV